MYWGEMVARGGGIKVEKFLKKSLVKCEDMWYNIYL